MKKIIFAIAILSLICNNLFSQNTKERALAKATADSSSFVINTKDGWLQYGSTVALHLDSIMLETIVQHSKTGIDWSKELLIGKVKSNGLRPAKSQTALFNLLTSSYQVRVEPNGKCFLRLVSGDLPHSDPVIIPIRAVYKK